MGIDEGGAAFYRARAAEMRAKADEAQTDDVRASFLHLEASWLRLADAADKKEAATVTPVPLR